MVVTFWTSPYRGFLNEPSLKAVKMLSDYMTGDAGVRTDVIIFNRKHSSEFDIEREQMKDELLAWNERYKKRMEDKIASTTSNDKN